MSTLLSIQSLMNPNPYHNEPGFEEERDKGAVESYNDCIRHESVRVAVVGMLKHPTCGALFRDEIVSHFKAKFQFYLELCEKYKHLSNQQMRDPFSNERGSFAYDKLVDELKQLHGSLEDEKAQQNEHESDSADDFLVSSARYRA
jgi:ubiquitin-conjugating enzyme E2 Z